MNISFDYLKPIIQQQEKPLLLLAGPCSAESRAQVIETARAIEPLGVPVFRAGIWKPRTMPGGFEGIGEKGLAWLQEVKTETGMMTATEVATPAHVETATASGINVLWIGARTTANTFAVQEIADSLKSHPEVAVLVKNPVSNDLDLWIGALMRIYDVGIRRLGAVHRGIPNSAQHTYRNEPQWHIPIELKRRFPNLPVIADPSHIAGRSDLVPIIAQQALDLGFDGLMIETHISPREALSDKEQQLTPDELRLLINSLNVKLHQTDDQQIAQWRKLIDQCDYDMLNALAKRMDIARRIGEHKKRNNIAIVQNSRFNDIINDRKQHGKEAGLSPQFVENLMQLIHQEAVDQQIDHNEDDYSQ